MANKEKIDYLLLDIKELETLIAGMRDAEVYPVSFFSQLQTWKKGQIPFHPLSLRSPSEKPG